MRLLVENIEAANKGAGGRIDSLKKDLRGNMINVNQSLKLINSFKRQPVIHTIFHFTYKLDFIYILQITGHCQVLSHV